MAFTKVSPYKGELYDLKEGEILKTDSGYYTGPQRFEIVYILEEWWPFPTIYLMSPIPWETDGDVEWVTKRKLKEKFTPINLNS